MIEKTVRELGGEIWSELTKLQQDGHEVISCVDVGAIHAMVDVAMSVLAKHCGDVIVNDPDMPVVPSSAAEE